MIERKRMEEIRMLCGEVPDGELLVQLFDQTSNPDTLVSDPYSNLLRSNTIFDNLRMSKLLGTGVIVELNQLGLYSFLLTNGQTTRFYLAREIPVVDIYQQAAYWRWKDTYYELITAWAAGRWSSRGEELRIGNDQPAESWSFGLMPEREFSQMPHYFNHPRILPDRLVTAGFIVDSEVVIISDGKYGSRNRERFMPARRYQRG